MKASTATPMSPGTYLRKRREAARLGVRQAAADLSVLPFGTGRTSSDEVVRLAQRINAAEDDTPPFPLEQAEILRNVFAFDLAIYETLLLHHVSGPACGLPVPQVCRECACSWHDPCVMPIGRSSSLTCSWVRGDPTLCTRCATASAPQPLEIVPVLSSVEGLPA